MLLSAMASADLRRELECCICLSTYIDPVNLKCGHSFCRLCIQQVLDTQEASGDYICPHCRKRFRSRPTLQRNITLCKILENFRCTPPNQDQSGIFCTYCIHAPVEAVQSCLLCEAFLCENHLKVHSKSPEHILSTPTTSLKNKKCSVHKKVLEYYCTEDTDFICVSCCLIGDHKGHRIESLEEAFEKIKKKQKNGLQKLMRQIGETERRVQSLQELNRKVQGKASKETERVTRVFGELRRQLEVLENKVLDRISCQAQCPALSDLIQQLEIKKEELSKKMQHIEELCNLTDPYAVLQESDTDDLFDTEEDDNERQGQPFHDVDLDVTCISQMLSLGLGDIMTGINGGLYTPGPEDIILDVNTASNRLLIADDKSSVSKTQINQKRPEHPKRFKHIAQVLSSQSFSSGRHYWEVDVGESVSWIVGMCYPSVDRKAISRVVVGCNHKSWSLYKRDNDYLMMHNRKMIQLSTKSLIRKVRVYLDYEARQISFYDLGPPIQHLHTFTAAFTEPLHAGLCLVKNGTLKIIREGGKMWDVCASLLGQ